MCRTEERRPSRDTRHLAVQVAFLFYCIPDKQQRYQTDDTS